jgi:hypothetical protein
MRLLERQNEGDFRLTANVLDRDLPRYAILSHTWGDDSEEVSYEDPAGPDHLASPISYNN